jgi:hypothetical protein
MTSISAPSPTLLRFLRQQAHAFSCPAKRPLNTALLASAPVRKGPVRQLHGRRLIALSTTTSSTTVSSLCASTLTRPCTTGHVSSSAICLASSSQRRSQSRLAEFWRRWSVRRLNNRLSKVAAAAGPDRIPPNLLGSAVAQDRDAQRSYAPLGAFLGDDSYGAWGNGGSETSGTNGASGSCGHGVGGGGALPGLLRGPSRMKELKLRCTEFNEKGAITLVSAEFQKQQLIAKVWSP